MQTLRLFSDVARLHSFSQAASLHGITQSAASQRVSALERKLGVTLLDRSVRPLTLTEAGRIFLSGCEDLLDRYDRLEQRVAGLAAGHEGPVRVAAIYSAGIDLLNNVRERFVAIHPRVDVQIRYEQPDQVYEAVRGGACDLGIVSYPQRWRHVGVIPLRDEVMAVVCRPEHPLARQAGRTVYVGELAGLAMAGFEADLPVGRRIREYLRDHEAHPRLTNVFDNIDTIKSAIAVTDEFAILPKRTVVREVRAGSLAMIDLEPRLVRPIGVIHRPRRAPRRAAGDTGGFPPAVQAFVDFLLDHAGPSVDLVGQVLQDQSGEPRPERELVGATR
jgi:DNA-binding transcriptional LysR family regulator